MKKIVEIIIVTISLLLLCSCSSNSTNSFDKELDELPGPQNEEITEYEQTEFNGLKFELPKSWKCDELDNPSATTYHGDKSMPMLGMRIETSLGDLDLDELGTYTEICMDAVMNGIYNSVAPIDMKEIDYLKTTYGTIEGYEFEVETVFPGFTLRGKGASFCVNKRPVYVCFFSEKTSFDSEIEVFDHFIDSVVSLN